MKFTKEQKEEILPYIGKKVLCIKDKEDKFIAGKFYLIVEIQSLMHYMDIDGGPEEYEFITFNDRTGLMYSVFKSHFDLVTVAEIRQRKIDLILE